jgi:two-component system chemotaxis response regulator CheY
MWNVLVVDDDFVNRKLLVESLKELADCDTAAGGKEAIAAYELALENGKPYDVILLDIAMPEVNGIEVLKFIRNKETTMGVLFGHGVPVIMTTAFREPFLEAFNKGCDDYIVKPVMPDVLIKKIQEKLYRRK